VFLVLVVLVGITTMMEKIILYGHHTASLTGGKLSVSIETTSNSHKKY